MIPPRKMLTADDKEAVRKFLELDAPLSGYLAGNPYGGAAVQRLEEMWCQKFNRQHAIAVNSATSGLLAACEAVNMRERRYDKYNDIGPCVVAVPALSMSATAVVARYCGANLRFLDVDKYGCAALQGVIDDAAIITSVFGHPPSKGWLGYKGHAPVILDNAQGICARDEKGWIERLGTITVTSFNVHKQINAGEGGIISTDDDVLAVYMRDFINHGENSPASSRFDERHIIGLNLRMTELSAVLALSQLQRIDDTIGHLNALCRRLDNALPSTFIPLGVREGCYSARYCYAFKAADDCSHRNMVINYLMANGVPAIPMYRPLYELPAFRQFTRECSVAEQMADGYVVFELCSWRYENDIAQVARVLQEAAKI